MEEKTTNNLIYEKILGNILREHYIAYFKNEMDENFSKDVDCILEEHQNKNLLMDENFNKYLEEYNEIEEISLVSFQKRLEEKIKTMNIEYANNFALEEINQNNSNLGFKKYYYYRKKFPNKEFPECATDFALSNWNYKLFFQMKSNE
jgi:hypothetical protein